MKMFTIGLLSAAALATTVLLVRQQKEDQAKGFGVIRPGEAQPVNLSLDRIRELGL